MAEALRERGVSLRSLSEQIDTGTAAGKMLYAVLGAVAQFERDVPERGLSRGSCPLRVAASALDGARHCRQCSGAKR